MSVNSIQHIKGVGEKRAEALESEAGISTIEDLLSYKPRRYIDNSSFSKIIDLEADQRASVIATVREVSTVNAKKRFLQVTVTDDTAGMKLLFFGGIPFYSKIFVPGITLLISGKIGYSKKSFFIVHPDYDILFDEDEQSGINTGRIVPVYPLTEKLRNAGITSRVLRKIFRTALDEHLTFVKDPLDDALRSQYNLMPLEEAYRGIHFPSTFEEAARSRTRFAFNELLVYQIYLSLLRKISKKAHTPVIGFDDSDRSFIHSLPFTLTDGQNSALEDIKKDIASGVPMNRLLQGDVGCGKTVVAVCASVLVKYGGGQVAVMAPTEILAGQLAANFKKLSSGIATVELLTSSITKKEKQRIAQECSAGAIDIIIGTQALIQDYLSFKDLRLVVIDEQHRFGVNQRTALRGKGQNIPHLLSMTATPIPRSLALTLYGDFDISVITSKPTGRGSIKTMSFPESRSAAVYNSVKKYLSEGRQAYIVLPLIEESDTVELKSAQEMYSQLSSTTLKDFSLALLHGKMKNEEKASIMERFRSGEIQLLVATTVIEVGVDVPNASIMVIYHPERFGLAQLHQLRGRVGRGSHDSFCVLVYPDRVGSESLERIEAVVKISDGFELSELDLKMRGHGEIIGYKQSGFVSEFEFADISEDIDIISKTRDLAAQCTDRLESIENDSDIAAELVRLKEKGFRIRNLNRYLANLT